MRVRLSLLMFLQYAIPGAWVPLFSRILQELQFTPGQIAWASATYALSALVSPLLWGQIADRWLSAQYCISSCAFFCGVLLWVLGDLTTFWPVFAASVVFWFFMIAAISLGTALTFRHLHNPERDFGPVRLWGTVGWVTPNWVLSFWFSDPDVFQTGLTYLRPSHPLSEWGDAFRLGGIMAFVLGCFALTLPRTPPSPSRLTAATGPGWLRRASEAPLLAFQLLRQRSFAVYCVCLMGVYITYPFSTQLTPLLLESLGVTKSWLPVTLTVAQSLEVATLALLPIILLRLEIKGTLFLGLLAWLTAVFVLTLGQPAGLVIPCLGLQGVFITCFLVAGQVFVNRRAQKDVRASAQALLQFLNGIGLLGGNLLVGWIRSQHPDSFVPAYGTATIIAAVMIVVFVIGFRAKMN